MRILVRHALEVLLDVRFNPQPYNLQTFCVHQVPIEEIGLRTRSVPSAVRPVGSALAAAAPARSSTRFQGLLSPEPPPERRFQGLGDERDEDGGDSGRSERGERSGSTARGSKRCLLGFGADDDEEGEDSGWRSERDERGGSMARGSGRRDTRGSLDRPPSVVE